MDTDFLEVEGVTKTYGGHQSPRVPVLHNVHLRVARGQIACLLGRSGCGKSTLLKIIAGLLPADAGAVFVGGREVRGPGLDRGVVFQDHALFPWLSVLDNIRFAVRSRWPAWKRAQVDDHALRYLSLVGLDDVKERRPSALSGGMRQRVGVARALAVEPKVLLLDEPFGALDPQTRSSLQDQLLNLCKQLGQTVFMITHDVDEAILLADTVLLLSPALASSVINVVPVNLPTSRRSQTLHRQPGYSVLRHRLLDYLFPSTIKSGAGIVRAAVVPITAETIDSRQKRGEP